MKTTSRNFTTLIMMTALFLLMAGCSQESEKNGETASRPNVVLIMTDDQGHGDLGYHGNHHIMTPVLDSLADASTRFTNFYVSPVCAPTRSSLMTGRYSLRTGVRDTYNGGAIMSEEEVTIAEVLKKTGYATGIFGKWHLGDNYPSRPMDQGFDESVIHLSGGMGQVGDFTTYVRFDSSYFDPVLWHNGEKESYKGYCSDIFTNQAIRFIEENQDSPFFCYLSFNAPHTPLQVPEAYYKMYEDIDPSAGFDGPHMPEMSEKNKEDARKVYGMVSNIDDNVGKLINQLNALGLQENTILIFMTDNGPQQPRYISGMRGRKGDVYRGGVRVPFFFSYPEKFTGNRDVSAHHAHIDVLPTLAELCKAEVPADRIIDGVSMVPELNGQETAGERTFFFYWSRKFPEIYNNISLQQGTMKIIGNTNHNAKTEAFELYDLSTDEGEWDNIMDSQPETGQEMRQELDRYIKELTAEEHLLQQSPIIIGSSEENPVYLNRNDAAGERGIWKHEEVYGFWNVETMEGTYDIRFKFFNPVEGRGVMYLESGGRTYRKSNEASTDMIEMKNVEMARTKGEFIPFYRKNNKRIFPFWVEVTRTDE